jgi:hypothetical protein
MAFYTYKKVAFRDDFTKAQEEFEAKNGYEIDDGFDYNGDCWLVVNYLLDSKDKEIARLKELLNI